MGFKHKLLAVIQHVVMLYKDEVLLLRYSDYQGKGPEGMWGLPGGHYNMGAPVEDLMREVKEETGIEVCGDISLLKTYVVMFPDGVERFGVFYLCRLEYENRPPVVLSYEHDGYMWIGRSGLEEVSFIGPNQRNIVRYVFENLAFHYS